MIYFIFLFIISFIFNNSIIISADISLQSPAQSTVTRLLDPIAAITNEFSAFARLSAGFVRTNPLLTLSGAAYAATPDGSSLKYVTKPLFYVLAARSFIQSEALAQKLTEFRNETNTNFAQTKQELGNKIEEVGHQVKDVATNLITLKEETSANFEQTRQELGGKIEQVGNQVETVATDLTAFRKETNTTLNRIEDKVDQTTREIQSLSSTTREEFSNIRRDLEKTKEDAAKIVAQNLSMIDMLKQNNTILGAVKTRGEGISTQLDRMEKTTTETYSLLSTMWEFLKNIPSLPGKLVEKSVSTHRSNDVIVSTEIPSLVQPLQLSHSWIAGQSFKKESVPPLYSDIQSRSRVVIATDIES